MTLVCKMCDDTGSVCHQDDDGWFFTGCNACGVTAKVHPATYKGIKVDRHWSMYDGEGNCGMKGHTCMMCGATSESDLEYARCWTCGA